MLTQTAQESESINSGKTQKRLYWSQLGLTILILSDIALLIAHYQFDFLTNERTVLDPDVVQQDPRWVDLRTVYKCIQLVIYFLLEIIAIFLFMRVYRALPTEAEYEPVRRQAYYFIVVFFVETMLRLIGQICTSFDWIVRN